MSAIETIDEFIEVELRAFARYLYEQMRQQVRSRNIMESKELLESFAWEAAKREFGLRFARQGRMHDMGAGRGYRKGVYTGQDRSGPHPGHRPSKFYSRTAWGAIYGTLVNNLMNKYTAAVVQLSKDTMTNGLN